MDDFIQAFRRSQLHEREQALALLLAELNPYEWRALHAMTGRRTFQTDIIGRLPIELVAQIFTYLDPAAPFRCQIVSKQWHHVLTSLSVIKASLNTWYRGSLDTLQADYAFCKKIASTIHAFRTGHPRNVYEITFDGVLCNDLILVGDHLIWTRILNDDNEAANTSSSIHIFNLHDWQLRTVGCAGREQIDRIFASDQIVVMLNYTTTVYVCELHSTKEPKSFTVPSLDYIKDISCRERTVAGVATFPKHASVCIWDYDTQQGRSFDIKYDSDPLFRGFVPSRDYRICPLVQPETETIILIFVINTFTKDGRVEGSKFVIGRYTYRGECIASSRTSFPEIDRVEEWPNEELMFEPADESDSVFTLTPKALSHDYYAEIPWKYWIDEKTLDMRAWDVPKLHSHASSNREALQTTWWKDTCYGYSLELRGIYADRLAYMGTEEKEAYVPILRRTADSSDRNSIHPTGTVLLNGKYVIKEERESLCVLCFEENGNRPKDKHEGDFFGIGWIESIDFESTEPENAK